MEHNVCSPPRIVIVGRAMAKRKFGRTPLACFCLSTDLHTLICILDLPVSSMGIGNSHRHCRVIEQLPGSWRM